MPDQTSPNDPRAITRIMLRPIGSPLPLGLFAFCFGTVLYSALELQWLPPDQSHVIAVVMLGFVAPLELIPAILAFFARDTVGATLLALFGMTWVVVGCFQLGWPPGSTSPALGLLLAMTAAAMLGIAIIALSSKPFFSVILLTASLRTSLLALHHFGLGKTIDRISGVIGLVLGAIALYGALALLIEDTRQETTLPLFRRGAAKRAIEGELSEQIAATRRQAGVRQQL